LRDETGFLPGGAKFAAQDYGKRRRGALMTATARREAWQIGAAGVVGAVALARISTHLLEQREESEWAEQLVRRLEEQRTIPRAPNLTETPTPAPRLAARRHSAAPTAAQTPADEDRRRRRELRARRRARAERDQVLRPPAAARLRTTFAASRLGRFAVPVACGLAVLIAAPGLFGSHAGAVGGPLPKSASPYARRDIPARYFGLYVQAARRYHLDWATLAAVGQVESNHGRSPFPGVRTGTNRDGAAGPAQFLARTWARYAIDANDDGSISPYDPADAIWAMAAYLRASGAPDNWPRALFTYNHSEPYVVSVLALSRRYEPPTG
jgi:hypothetical protein